MTQVIPERVVVAGNPAKVVRELKEVDITRWSDAKQLYIDLAAKYLRIGMHRIPDENYVGYKKQEKGFTMPVSES